MKIGPIQALSGRGLPTSARLIYTFLFRARGDFTDLMGRA
jgi:hypothetical protein